MDDIIPQRDQGDQIPNEQPTSIESYAWILHDQLIYNVVLVRVDPIGNNAPIFSKVYHEFLTFLSSCNLSKEMITEILNENLIGKKILDMGCGTGILTILASKMGAERVTAIDIDSWAFNSSVENTKSNSVSNADIILGGAEVIPDQKFDFIYANIQRNILLKDMASYVNVLNKGGELIMSGFYRNDLESIKEKATELGLQFIRVTENATWVAAAFTSK